MQIRKWSFFVLPRKVNGSQYQVVVGNVAGFEKKEKEEEEEEEEEEEQEKKEVSQKDFCKCFAKNLSSSNSCLLTEPLAAWSGGL